MFHTWDELTPFVLLLGVRWDPLGQTGNVRGAELELGSVPVGQHRALSPPSLVSLVPPRGPFRMFCVAAGPVPGVEPKPVPYRAPHSLGIPVKAGGSSPG